MTGTRPNAVLAPTEDPRTHYVFEFYALDTKLEKFFADQLKLLQAANFGAMSQAGQVDYGLRRQYDFFIQHLAGKRAIHCESQLEQQSIVLRTRRVVVTVPLHLPHRYRGLQALPSAVVSVRVEPRTLTTLLSVDL